MRKIATIQVGRPLAPATYIFQTKPLPKGRPRSFAMGKRIVTKTDERTRYYEGKIAQAAALQHPIGVPFEGELRVFLTFFFNTRVHGDLDNLAKAILDAVQARTVVEKRKRRTVPGIVMANDKQIKALSIAFVYDKGCIERTEMIVDRYDEEDIKNARALANVPSAIPDCGDIGDFDGDGD